MPNPKVEQFSRDVIGEYHANATNAGDQPDRTVRAQTIAAASKSASDRGLFATSRAADMAKTSIETFRQKTEAGIEPREAAKVAAKEVSQRYDAMGRDTHRQRSQELSL